MALASLALGISERLDYFVTNTLGQQGNTFSWQKQIHFIHKKWESSWMVCDGNGLSLGVGTGVADWIIDLQIC